MEHQFRVGQVWEDGQGIREFIVAIDDPMFPQAPIRTRGGYRYTTSGQLWCPLTGGGVTSANKAHTLQKLVTNPTSHMAANGGGAAYYLTPLQVQVLKMALVSFIKTQPSPWLAVEPSPDLNTEDNKQVWNATLREFSKMGLL